MKRVRCIKNPPLTEYQKDKVYDAYWSSNGEQKQLNVCYEDGSDSAFSVIDYKDYFEFI